MGFSISGSAAIVFAGMFIAFGIFYGATSNSLERVSEAQSDQIDDALEEKNTDIEIVSYELDEDPDPDELTVSINNTGANELSINQTDILIDNTVQENPTTTIIYDDGTTDADTDVWATGEQLNMTVEVSNPQRAKVVTEHGVAASVDVSGDTAVVF